MKAVLLYQLEQGPVEQRIIQQCMRERLPLPKKISDAPELPLGTEFFYGAFTDLNSCRPSAWGMAPILWSAMKEYAVAHELGDEEVEDLFFFVSSLDQAFREYHDKQNKK